MYKSSLLSTVLFSSIIIATACSGENEISDGGQSDGAVDAGVPDAGEAQYVYTDTPFAQWLKEEFTVAAGNLPWNDVKTLAVDAEGVVWAGGSGGLVYYTDTGTQIGWHQDLAEGPILSMTVSSGTLYAATSTKIFRRTGGGGWAVSAELEGVVSLAPNGAETVVVEKRGVGVIGSGGYTLSYSDAALDGRAAVTALGKLYVATSHGVAVLIGNGPGFSLERYLTSTDGLPSDDVRTAAADSSGRPWFGTSAGIAFWDGEKLDVVTGNQGLPYDDVTHISFVDAETLLVSTTIGAADYYLNLKKFRYFHDRYWLPDNQVRAGLADRNWSLFFATAGGIARIRPEYATLAAKAAHYDQMNRARHGRMGFYTRCVMKTPGDVSTWYNVDDDNDGQWTGMYLGSLSYQYAVTGDPTVRGWAKESMQAMLRLESITETPGFFARSIVAGADCPAKQQGGGEWHPTSDGQWCWKGDTSTDEFVGHIFGLSLYYDLVADDAEKKDIAADVSRILTRIIDYGYVIADIDGVATTDGHFDPMFMESVGLMGDAGLNSAMILGGLLFGYRATGDKKFMDAFNYLAKTKGYKNYVRDLKEIGERWHVNHDSHEMSFLALHTLIRYETDPQLKELWLKGIYDLWESQRPERNPEFNYIYAASTGALIYDWEQATDTLKRIHWELTVWGSKNSHRKDITVDPKLDRQGHRQSTVVLPYDERNVMKWNDNPFRLDDAADGYTEESATYWLLPYWMARHHKLISPPKTGPE